MRRFGVLIPLLSIAPARVTYTQAIFCTVSAMMIFPLLTIHAKLEVLSAYRISLFIIRFPFSTITVFTPARSRFPSMETSPSLNTRMDSVSPSLVDFESISYSEVILATMRVPEIFPDDDLLIFHSSAILPDEMA